MVHRYHVSCGVVSPPISHSPISPHHALRNNVIGHRPCGNNATALTTPTTTNRTEDYAGPENGHLVIVGGNLSNETIYEKIIALAGGPSAPFVVIPTAGGDATYNDSFPAAETFRRLGATSVTVLHTYDLAVADTDKFIAPLKEAKGIFFGGGSQWRLVDAYAGTKSERAFQDVLDRGGVISGSSAGASIHASLSVNPN